MSVRPTSSATRPDDTSAAFARLVELERECAELRGQLGIVAVDPRAMQLPSDRAFSLIEQQGTDMLSVHRADGAYVYASPACRTLFGHEPGVLVGRSAYDFIHVDDRERVSAHHRAHATVSDPAPVEYRFLRSDGGFSWVETNASASRRDDRGFDIVCITRDVSHRRAEEDARGAAHAEVDRFLAELNDAGMLPICAWCKAIREEDGTWIGVDAYLRKHLPLEFTHGVCPVCVTHLRDPPRR